MLRGHTLECEKDRAAFKLIEEVKNSLPDKPYPNLIRCLLEIDQEKRISCRDALSLPMFKKAGYEVPPVSLIDFATCLPDHFEVANNSEKKENAAPSAGAGAGADAGEKKKNKKGGSSGGGMSTEELTRLSRMKKAISGYCRELNCVNPKIEQAALLYATELRHAGCTDVDVGSSVLLDCCVLAEKFFDTQERDLDDLDDDDGEETPSFKNWTIETYKKNERLIFMTMDYCLYLRNGDDGNGKSGGRKKKGRA